MRLDFEMGLKIAHHGSTFFLIRDIWAAEIDNPSTTNLAQKFQFYDFWVFKFIRADKNGVI